MCRGKTTNASSPWHELPTAQDVNLDDALAPVPHLFDTEFFSDRQLVDAAVRPFHLDGEVRPLPIFLAEDVALVGLRSAPFPFFPDRPTADRFELNPAIGTPRLEQAADARLDDLVIAGRTEDLDFPLEIADPGSGVIAAQPA